MTDQTKTRSQLIDELNRLRRRLTELESDGTARLAVKAVAKYEASSSSVIENASEGILIADAETMSFQHANPAICHMLGYTMEELLKLTVTDIHPEASLDHVVSEFKAQSRGEKKTARNLPCLRKDGRTLYVDISISNITINGKPYSVGFFTDVTERREAEDALRVSERTYREIFDAVSDALFVHDPTTGAILDVNNAMCSLFGCTRDEARQLSVADISLGQPPYSQNEASELIGKVRGEGQQQFEWLARKRSGELFWIEVTLKRTVIAGRERILALARDISDRKAAEEALKASERNYREIFDAANDAIAVMDPKTGWVLDVNKADMKLCGYTRQEALALKAGALSDDPKDADQISVHDWMGRAIDEGPQTFERLCRKKDGSEYWAEVSLKQAVIGGEERVLSVIRDITERKQAEHVTRLQRELAKGLSEATNLDEALTLSMKTAIEASGMDSGGLYLVDESTGAVDLRCSHNLTEEITAAAAHYEADSPQARLVSGGLPVYVSREELARRINVPPVLERVTAVAILPIRHEGRPIACLNVSSHTAEEIPESARNVLEAMAAEVGGTISRLRVQEALLESEQRFQDIAMSSADWIWEVDAEGSYTFASGQVKALLGYEARELIGTNVLDHLVPEERVRVTELLRNIVAARMPIVDLENWNLSNSGEKVCLLTNATPIIGDDGELLGYRGLDKDITARKKREAALREASDIISKSPAVAFLWRNNPDWSVEFVTDNVKRLCGYSAEELKRGDISYSDLIHPDDLERVAGEINGHTADPDRNGFTHDPYRLVTRDGAIRWVEVVTEFRRDESGGTTHFQALVIDITARKQAEDALAESEARYHEVFDTVQEGIGIVDQDENVRFANPALAVIFGEKSVESLLGKCLFDYVTEEGRQKITEETARRKCNLTSKYELDILCANGERKTILVSVTPRIDDTGRYLGAVGSSLDITDRKRAEEALAEAKERYRVLFEKAGEGIVVLQDGYLKFVNPAWQRIVGFDQEELKAKPFQEFVYHEDVDVVLKNYRRRLAAEDTPTTYDMRVVAKDGDIRWVRTTAAVIDWSGSKATLAFLADVTERKRAEEEIRKFKTISDNASYGTVIADMNLNTLYVNECFARMHGYTVDEMMGVHYSFCHTEEQMESAGAVADGLLRNGSMSSVELWHKHRDGTVFPTLMNGSIIRDDAGQPQFIAVTALDITETKRLQEFADRAHRLETAGRIAGQVAHDFNNLLGPLVAYPEFIKEELGSDHAAVTFLESMEVAAQQMAEINQQLLTLGRRGHYNLEPVNLNRTMEQAVRQMHAQPKTLEVVTDLSPDLSNIKAGVSQIFRVISNLITNAVDSMQGIGTLTITTENWQTQTAAGSYGQIPPGDYVRLTVADTGCGIPDDVLPHVFEPFYTTKKADKRKGSGLGLSVVHAVMEDHDGHIDLLSQVGRGTSAQLYFPVSLEQLRVEETDTIRGGSETILVVDDDDVQREVTLKILERFGYRACAVESGEKAIEFIKGQPCDLILLDMTMPGGMDGAETYQRALEINSELRAVVVSGYAESGRVAEVQMAGAGAFIRKPLTVRSVGAAVRHELDRVRTAEPVT